MIINILAGIKRHFNSIKRSRLSPLPIYHFGTKYRAGRQIENILMMQEAQLVASHFIASSIWSIMLARIFDDYRNEIALSQ